MIDPRAVVDPKAQLDEQVSIGPYSIIGPQVRIGKGTRIGPHVVITGQTTLGQYNEVFQFASLGEAPQDVSYQGEPTRLQLGDHNVVRESVTISRGTQRGGGLTRLGDHNFIMAYVHIAHDCLIGNHCIFSNAASLAGHVHIEDHAILGGFTLVHQYCRIGAHAFTSMGAALNRDLPPYTLASGNYARAIGINKLGLKRRGFSAASIQALHRAFKYLVRTHDRTRGFEAVQALQQQYPEVLHFVTFIRQSQRGIVRTGRRHTES